MHGSGWDLGKRGSGSLGKVVVSVNGGKKGAGRGRNVAQPPLQPVGSGKACMEL